MQNKIKQLCQEVFTIHKKTLKPFRATLYPKVINIKNTIFENNSLVSVNADTNITLKLPKKGRYFKIVTDIISKEGGETQLFYKSKETDSFSKSDSIILGDTNKVNTLYIDTQKDVFFFLDLMP